MLNGFRGRADAWPDDGASFSLGSTAQAERAADRDCCDSVAIRSVNWIEITI